MKQLKKLMKSTEKVDYDMEAYVREAKHIIKQLPSASVFAGTPRRHIHISHAKYSLLADEVDKYEEQIQMEAKLASKSSTTGTNKRR